MLFNHVTSQTSTHKKKFRYMQEKPVLRRHKKGYGKVHVMPRPKSRLLKKHREVDITTDTSTACQLDNFTPTSPPVALPIKIKPNELPSSEIDQSSLQSIDAVLSNYQHFITANKPAALARRLACEAVLGIEAMIKCTNGGCSNKYGNKYPALPSDMMYIIKQTVLNVFPIYWTNLSEFEEVWKKCSEGIGSTCSLLRRQRLSGIMEQ